MAYELKNKNLQIVSAGVILAGIIFSYIYKLVHPLVAVNVLDKLLLQVTLVACIVFGLRLYTILKEKNNKFLNLLFIFAELSLAFYIVLINSSLIWPYFLLSIFIINAVSSYGYKYGLGILAVMFIIMVVDILLDTYLNNILDNPTKVIELGLVFVVQIFIWYISLILKKQSEETIDVICKKDEQIKENIDANNKLQTEKDEIKSYNKDLELAYKKLEDTNQLLNKSAAQNYTLQQISQAITTIVDVEELLRFVNDIIIGVMGVSYSSVLLLDKKLNKMQIKVSNIFSENILDAMKSNINCAAMTNICKGGISILENRVNNVEYPFTKGRNIKSLLCVPLYRKGENFGAVLLEQEIEDAFEKEHLKFLTTICNQISIKLENVSLYERMHRMATIDALTNIYNRLYFNERFSKELVKADQENYPLSVCIFDIDHFKKFNDTYGHLFGDLVLKTIAKVSQKHIREQDIVARYGGEEFVVVMPNATLDQSYQIIEELRKKIASYQIKDGSISAGVTASFGISCYPEHGRNESEILINADEALYQAKSAGRNRTKIFGEK